MKFHELEIAQLARDSAEAVCLWFAVPPALREEFKFTPGQFLTLKATVDGQELRRNYSICSSTQRYAQSGELAVAIKRVPQGRFSNFACDTLAQGARLAVQKPDGRFTQRSHGERFLAIAAGSGITPILSLMESSLRADPAAHWSLLYGNQRVQSMMFGEALADLKDEFSARLNLMHSFSKQHQEFALANGRIDAGKLHALEAAGLLRLAQMDEIFICGPEGLIDAAQPAIAALAPTAAAKIRVERFVSAEKPISTSFVAIKNSAARATGMSATLANKEQVISLEIVESGKTHALSLAPDATVLDTALAAGLDLPYACRGGVCCTCRCKVLEGGLGMRRNFTLEQDEVDAGFVLSCQAFALPNTQRVVLSFDER